MNREYRWAASGAVNAYFALLLDNIAGLGRDTASIFGLSIFVGHEISAQGFLPTPKRHYPVLVLACAPALAFLAFDLSLVTRRVSEEKAILNRSSLTR